MWTFFDSYLPYGTDREFGFIRVKYFLLAVFCWNDRLVGRDSQSEPSAAVAEERAAGPAAPIELEPIPPTHDNKCYGAASVAPKHARCKHLKIKDQSYTLFLIYTF